MGLKVITMSDYYEDDSFDSESDDPESGEREDVEHRDVRDSVHEQSFTTRNIQLVPGLLASPGHRFSAVLKGSGSNSDLDEQGSHSA